MARNRWPIGEVVRWKAGEVHPYLDELPHWRKVPKEPVANLRFRSEVRKKCAASATWRMKISEWCAEDPVFFCNLACWIHEPRFGESIQGLAPFITWRHQDPVIAASFKYFGVRHMVGPKSRAQGASWIACLDTVHAFLYRKGVVLGLGSKTMDYADNVDKPLSLGWKIDFILDNLPPWMRPQYERKTGDHIWCTGKKASNNTIVAEASTDGIGRGARYTRHTLDEGAFYPSKGGGASMAVQNLVQVTNQIVFPSTPNGESGEGAEFFQRATTDSTWLRYILHWQDNPIHSAGLYTSVDGKLKILDPTYDFGDYEFILDGRVRSPWYDGMWYDMRCSVIDVSRELDMDFGGSKAKPFSEEILRLARLTVRSPSRSGELYFEQSDIGNASYLRFIDGKQGKLKIWFPIDLSGFPPPGEYVIGCDIAAGTGGESANNSALCVFNSHGEQVAEFASNTIDPTEFAQLAVAVCYWFGRGEPKPYMIWEKNGSVGMLFTKEIVRLGYPNVHWHEDKNGKRHDNPGYHTTLTHESLGPLRSAIHNRQVSLRSDALVTECGQYVWDSSGRTWIHPSSKDTLDASAAGLSHGDRAMAAAMCVIGMNKRNMLKEASARVQAEVDPEFIEGTIEHHFRMRRMQKSREALARSVW